MIWRDTLLMHTELCSDGYLDLYKKGKLTNKRKAVNPGKAVTGITIGSPELYEWMDDNPMIAAFPLAYVNDPRVIGSIDNMVSINSCISVDLYGQVNAESSGTRQISGTGGQLDFLEGASISRGGKSFICLASTYKDKEGRLHSNILPHFSGEIITSPRSQVYFIATEYGAVNMGRSENSRNRIFVEDGEGIRTQAFDPAKMKDPSLIIYAPVRVLGTDTIVTNGDQTDTIYDGLKAGKTFGQSLRSREFEPDKPNYTPRISALMSIAEGKYEYRISILKSANGDPESWVRSMMKKGAWSTVCMKRSGWGLSRSDRGTASAIWDRQ